MFAHRDPAELRRALDVLLGAPWDDELDVFRAGVADDSGVRWLHRVG